MSATSPIPRKPDDAQPANGGPAVRSAEDALPPVQPPNAGFIIQLFFVPLVIVSIIVAVWLMFSWIATAGSNPRHLVKELRKNNDGSWQKAFELASMLRNSEAEAIKDDVQVVNELTDFLETEIALRSNVEYKVRMRVFLCRALGEFHRDEVIPVLIRAASTQNDMADLEVRTAAIEALTVFMNGRKKSDLPKRDEIFAALLAASRATSDNSDEKNLYSELRVRAAFALGVLGGEDALDRLEQMSIDSEPNVRFNAASGLARYGDRRAIGGLLEMLGEVDSISLSGVRATRKFLDSGGEKSQELMAAVEKLTTAQVPDRVRMEAQDLLYAQK